MSEGRVYRPQSLPLTAASFRPLRDYVLVRRAKHSGMSDGGLIALPSKHTLPGEGDVIAAGPGRLLDDGTVQPMAVSVGAHVYFGQYDGTDLVMDGEKCVLVRESELLAVET